VQPPFVGRDRYGLRAGRDRGPAARCLRFAPVVSVSTYYLKLANAHLTGMSWFGTYGEGANRRLVM
jgi:hypothetical protein